MKKPDLTLNDIRKSPKLGRVARVSDFVSQEEMVQVQINNARGKKTKRQFDDIDSLVAEMIARFGYDFYKDWNAGKIEDAKVSRMLLAERARERAIFLPLEATICHMVGACIKRHKGEKAPKGPKEAQKIIKAELKVIRGEG